MTVERASGWCEDGLMELAGDLGPRESPCRHDGPVRIGGSLRMGSVLVAAGDVNVAGMVEDSALESGGRVTVGGGIRGGSTGKIKAAGSLRARFLENVRVSVGGNLEAESVMHCELSVNGWIRVTSGKGLLVGGSVRSGLHLAAREIGSALATATILEVGVLPEFREELYALRDEAQRSKAKLKFVGEAIAVLKERERAGTLGPDQRGGLLEQVKERLTLLAALGGLEAREHEIRDRLARGARGWIDGARIHPGVRATVGWGYLFVQDELRDIRLTFLEESGEVAMTPVGGWRRGRDGADAGGLGEDGSSR
ncbi:MAG: DUF342 domain-containing protein [Firmicutes bacterium]|nr:DUF342 domain-containing protein [Bacillota bacterium]